MSFFENTRKPVGFSGKIMVAMMNFGHSAMAAWGLHFLQPAPDAMVLDCGCGGGANIKTLLKLCPNGKVQGIDYSAVSVEKARKVNARAIAAGRCTVQQASVAELPFEAEQFDVVTAFETVYFWPELAQNFREVYRVLKPGGTFYIFPKALEEDAKVFSQKALKYDLVLVPGDSFGAPGYFRMAYCVDTEKVERSLEALRKFVKTEYATI